MKRRTYIVDSGLQFKYAALVVSFAIIAAFLAGYTVFYTGWHLLGERLADVYPQGRLMVVIKTVNMALIRNIALLVPFILVISVLFSHRMAGPIIQIERVLDSIAAGDLDGGVYLRKRDEMKRVAEAINKMRMRLKDTRDKRDVLLASISEEISSLDDLLSRADGDNTKIRGKVAIIKKALLEARG